MEAQERERKAKEVKYFNADFWSEIEDGLTIEKVKRQKQIMRMRNRN